MLWETTPLCMAASRFKYKKYLATALRRILFSSMVMVLAFCPGVPGSHPGQILYFCHAFIHFFFVTDFVRKTFRIQTISRQNSNVAQTVLEENIIGKGGNTGFQDFLLCP